MHRLQNTHSGKNATIIFGGPSIIENGYDLSLLSQKDDVVFLESKALTPKFLEYGVIPDYYMMFYPEKTRTNTLQQQFIQSLSCGFELSKYLKEEYAKEWFEFRDKFGDYAKIGRIEYPHKRFRIKEKVILDNSPLSLISRFPNMKLITYDKAFVADGFSSIQLPNAIFKYTHDNNITNDFNKYFNPTLTDGRLRISSMGGVNSAAIALYPILNYMGFKKVSFVGMDMSILGQFEYSALYTFKSLNMFAKFVDAARKTYPGAFPLGVNKGLLRFVGSTFNDLKNMGILSLFSSEKFKKLKYDAFGQQRKHMRTRAEFKHCNDLFNYSNIEFINVCESFRYSMPIDSIQNVSFNEYVKQV